MRREPVRRKVTLVASRTVPRAQERVATASGSIVACPSSNAVSFTSPVTTTWPTNTPEGARVADESPTSWCGVALVTASPIAPPGIAIASTRAS